MMRAPRTRGTRCLAHDQHGSGTVLVAGTVLMMMAVAAALLVIGGYLVVADRASGAADLVAISAAGRVAQRGDGCRAAADVARRNSVSLLQCTVRGDGLDFVVSVTVRQPVRLRLPLLPDGVQATSHAGRLGVINRG